MELVINLELLFICLLLLANGVLAMSEIAVVASRKGRLQQLANEGDRRAAMALKLASEPNRFLSTVQIGITMVGILAGAFGGATLAAPISKSLSTIPLLNPYSDALALGLVVLVITFLSLIIGELVPKRLALHNPEEIAMAIAHPMAALSKAASPAVSLLSFSTDRVLKLLGVKEATEGGVTEEEIKILIQQGTKSGVFEEVEQEIVERVLHLGDRNISSLMTHRTLVEYLDLEDDWAEHENKIRRAPHSLFPVCRGGLDHVVGIVHVKHLLMQCIDKQPLNLDGVLRAAVFVPESMPVLKVLESFKKSSVHIALVTDEYGIVQGLVTLTDIMEGIVGDIPTEDELTDLQAIQREDGSWLLDGMMPIEEFQELLDFEEFPDDERGHYQTIGGFVMFKLERVPVPADAFDWGGWRFEVMDMDGNRVDKVLVMQLEPVAEEQPATLDE